MEREWEREDGGLREVEGLERVDEGYMMVKELGEEAEDAIEEKEQAILEARGRRLGECKARMVKEHALVSLERALRH